MHRRRTFRHQIEAVFIHDSARDFAGEVRVSIVRHKDVDQRGAHQADKQDGHAQ